jgi:tetratricopeptide (TPR) repeat protein
MREDVERTRSAWPLEQARLIGELDLGAHSAWAAYADMRRSSSRPMSDENATLLGQIAPLAPKYLERGTNVGRYVVLDRLGEGGMGIVYRAFDPELDRMVALKLLHTRSQTGTTIGDATWLLREAQALAKLSHPNVVTVHDVGVVREDQVFVAMELVDGLTLRAWLGAEKRSWREVRDVMLAAGAGLAAAHAAKLVHRDFKPDNVLVGKDGRVRVMDFGLARFKKGDTIPPENVAPVTTADPTIVEGVIGTPAYMAPEQFDGIDADARSDQFSFGVVLFEALTGGRPYAKDLVPTKASPQPSIPASLHVPARVADVAVRAVSIDPAKRFGSMNELLAALAIDPAAPRRRVAIGLGGIVIVAGAVVATRWFAPPAAKPCEGIEQRLSGIWDSKTKTGIEAAYLATKVPFAGKSFAALAPALDHYATAWVAMSKESCQATRLRRDQTEEVLSLRQACLDEDLAELGALTQLLADPNPLVVSKAETIVDELDKLARCGNVAALRDPGAPPPELAPQLAAIHAAVTDAKANTIVSRYAPAMIAANKAVELAQKAGFQPALAEALGVQGGVQQAAGNNEQAEATLTQMAWIAEVSKRDDLVAKAGIALANAMMYAQPPRSAEARVWLGLSIGAAKRVGMDHDFESDYKFIEAVVDVEQGNVTAAVAAGEASFAATEREYGKNSGVLFGHEILLAGTLALALEYAKAAPHYQHALAVRAQLVGEAYPEVALAMSNLAVCYHFMGELDKARTTFANALALREKLFGQKSPILVPTLDNYGVFLTQTDDPTKARAMLERALVLADVIPGKTSPDYHVIETDRADAVVAQGKLPEAHALFDELLVNEQTLHSTTLPVTQTSRAQLALVEKQYGDAERFASLAVTGFETAGGKDNPQLWRPLAALGRALAGEGKAAQAREALEASLAIGTRVQLASALLQPARDAVAKLPPDRK